jgi:UDP-2,3-diacylglucosamine pyrophosphatase LpxH
MSGGEHLLVVSDMHLTEEKPPHGLWKRYLQRDRFVDDDFAAWLRRMRSEIGGTICLVLNGDIFDFDQVMALPPGVNNLRYVERTRTLDPTEPKSAFKMVRIADDHPVFFQALRELLAEGHRIVVVVGNHDVELFWPAVQNTIRQRLGPAATQEALRFEPWFYQHGEVRIEHGHLLDPWCSIDDPHCPVVETHEGEWHVQVPFGNIAGRYLANRMGYFNPNCAESYQRSIPSYFLFWVRHHLFRFRPLITAWLVGAWLTLRHAARARRWRPVRTGERLPSPYQPPVYDRWFLMLRELWVDRLALALCGLAIVIGLAIAFGPGIWVWPALAGIVGVNMAWDRLVRRYVARSDTWLTRMHDAAPDLVRNGEARTLVLGHSHGWRKQPLPGGGFYLNSGNFSPSFYDVECNVPVPHSRTFVWLPPEEEPRVLEWRDGSPVRLA